VCVSLQAAVGEAGGEEEEEDKSAGSVVVSKPSPITLLKAIKNPVELESAKEAHLRDGAAEVEFLAWLDKVSC
jgi:Xaa-Pro aminopeptidase